MPNQELQFEEVSPEVIGTVQNGRVVMNEPVEAPLEPETAPEPKITPEPEPSVIPPERLQEISQMLVETAYSTLKDDFKAQLDGKDIELEDSRVGFDEELSKRDEEGKKTAETSKQKEKDTEGKHKEALKSKDAEIKEIKKQLADMVKANKKLLKQVQEALDAEE